MARTAPPAMDGPASPAWGRTARSRGRPTRSESEPWTRFCADLEREVAPDRAWRRGDRVGDAHQRADRLDRAVTLDDHRDERTAGDEVDEVAEERLALVLGVVRGWRSSRSSVRSSMATMVKPLRSSRPMISPTRPRRTPSGLTRTRVRSDTRRAPWEAGEERSVRAGRSQPKCHRPAPQSRIAASRTRRRQDAAEGPEPQPVDPDPREGQRPTTYIGQVTSPAGDDEHLGTVAKTLPPGLRQPSRGHDEQHASSANR